MQQEFAARKKAGFDVEFLSADDLQNYGLKASWAIISEKECVTNAYLLTHALLQHCIKKGLRVFDRTCINKIDYGKNLALQTAERYTVHAKHIINATGYEVVNFIQKGIVDFYCTYATVSEQSPEENEHWKNNIMMWNTEDPYLYMRLTADNRIIAGGRDDHFINPPTSESLLERKARLLQKDLKKILPGLRFKKEFVWSGTFGKTKDSLPYIGEYKKTPNAYYALGFGGNGITFSVVAAEILRDIFCKRQNAYKHIFSFER